MHRFSNDLFLRVMIFISFTENRWNRSDSPLSVFSGTALISDLPRALPRERGGVEGTVFDLFPSKRRSLLLLRETKLSTGYNFFRHVSFKFTIAYLIKTLFDSISKFLRPVSKCCVYHQCNFSCQYVSKDENCYQFNRPWRHFAMYGLKTSSLWYSVLTRDQWSPHNRSICLIFPHQLSVVSSQGIQISIYSSYEQQSTLIQARWRSYGGVSFKTPHKWAISLTKS